MTRVIIHNNFTKQENISINAATLAWWFGNQYNVNTPKESLSEIMSKDKFIYSEWFATNHISKGEISKIEGTVNSVKFRAMSFIGKFNEFSKMIENYIEANEKSI